MSNKLKKDKNKETQKSKVDEKAVINENDPEFIKYLKGRLIAQTDKSKKKNFYVSSILYFIIELLIMSITYKNFNYVIEGFNFTIFKYLTGICSIISIYNIIVSIIEIKKYEYKILGNKIMAVLHAILAIFAILIVVYL